MAVDERRSFDRVTERVKNFCALVSAIMVIVAAVVTTAWALYAVPDITDRIERRVSAVEKSSSVRFESIEHSLDYNGAQHRAMMSPSQIAKADLIYSQMRKQRGAD
jgi:anti-sigma-K factor RskA